MANDSVLLCESSQISVKWSINEFMDLPLKSNYHLESPSFFLSVGKWCLKIFPYKLKETVPYIGLFIAEKDGITDHSIIFKLTIKKTDGPELKVRETEHTFTREMPTWGWLYFMKRSSLLSSDKTATPDSSLKIFCNIRLKNAVEVTTQKPQIDGMEILSANFKHLYASKSFSDVTITVEGKEFPCHRNVLSARSAVFNSMFSHNMLEKNTGNVKIDDCDSESFEEFLLYIYSGKLDVVSSSHAISLYNMGDKYDLKDLRILCTQSMAISLSLESFCDVVHLATVHKEVELLTVAKKFFTDNARDILSTTKWQSFIIEHPLMGTELFLKFVDKYEK